ncbi:hypothetical protein BV20DRAFT_917091, partial [Pilatotrama ljubarskyi]
VPQCRICFTWRHTYAACNAKNEVCVCCAGNHHIRFHNLKATCCKDRPNHKANPCQHLPLCQNCQGAHFVNNPVCEYYKHRGDLDWYCSHLPSLA